DLALAAVIGLTHVERNGHHYADGFAGQHASVREQLTFLAGHPDLYAAEGDDVRVAIRDGRIAMTSLGGRGFASAAWPDIDTLTPMVPAPTADGDPPANPTTEVAR
ncbi:MAG TPA: mandelate racemase, partial [Casimicrobiaceae bacterium]|nr:mandelate racemase [Casimicrobiaceae bacterium]